MPMIDIDWLKDHVEVPDALTYEQLAKDLVKVGLEEETIHASQVSGPIVVGLVVGETPELQKNGKTIHWCQVDVGEALNKVGEDGRKVPRGIICGAPNIKTGEKVVVTLPGAVLPGKVTIEARKTYGHISDGMCASERELGLGGDHSGILLLREYGFTTQQYAALKPGEDAIKLLHLDQPLLEINITPDRGYTLSYRGVAREFHHSTGAAYTDPVDSLNEKLPVADGLGTPGKVDIEVSIEDEAPIHGMVGCDRYYARAVRNFNPEEPTPNWMRRRLIRAGMRSLSLAVDVTNYIMLDLGQPMHAYDLDKIVGPIVVRRALPGERMTTLDGKERNLSVEDLLITDSPDGGHGSRILGLAGVMGGLYSEVTSETKNVLLEAAHFDPITIARTARRHKIPSEASRRFERGVDFQLQPAAAQMACLELNRYGNGEPSLSPTDLNNTKPVKAIIFKANEVKRLTDLDTPINQISDILTDIGCSVAGGGNGEFSVLPPSWRPDLKEPCDLVEEIARLVGYDQIPVSVPSAPMTGAVGLTVDQRRNRQVADELAEYGLVEVLSYPFVGDEDFRAFSCDEQSIKRVSVEIANPLAGDRPFLRRSILMTLAQVVRRNLHRGIENVSLYEVGHVYLRDPNAPPIPSLPGRRRPSDEELKALDAGLPDQPLHVGAIFTGMASPTNWMAPGRSVDWSDAVEAVHRIGQRLGAHLELNQPPADEVPAQWHPGRAARIVTADGQRLGMVGELHPRLCQACDFPDHSAALELDLTVLFGSLNSKPAQAKPISLFPPVRQDLAFVVKESISAEQVRQVIVQAAGENLESIELFDVFTGEQVGPGMKSLAFSVTFRFPNKTLTGQDSEDIRRAIVAKAESLDAQLRA